MNKSDIMKAAEIQARRKADNWELTEAQEALIAAAELLKLVEWQPIDVRLPDDAQPVFVYTDAGNTFKAVFFKIYGKQNGWVLDHHLELRNQKITHWQPLPACPKVKGAL